MTGIRVLEADLFRALAHPVRVRLLEAIEAERLTVGELQAAVGGGSGAASHHLNALRRQGLIEGRKTGTSVVYRVKDARIGAILRLGRQVVVGRLAEEHALLDRLSHEGLDEAQA